MSEFPSQDSDEKPANLEAPDPMETRAFLLDQLEKMDRGEMRGFTIEQRRELRCEIKRALQALDDEGKKVCAPKEPVNKNGRVSIPAPKHRIGKVLEISFSEKTAKILSRYFDSTKWDESNRSTVVVLAMLIEEGASEDGLVPISVITEKTGYSAATIRSEIGTLRSVRDFKIVCKRGTASYKIIKYPGT